MPVQLNYSSGCQGSGLGDKHYQDDWVGAEDNLKMNILLFHYPLVVRAKYVVVAPC